MSVPPLPKKSSFLEHVRGSAKPAPAKPAPRTEIVRRRRNVKPEPWMINTAEKAFREGGTVKSVADLLNVTSARLSGWLAESEAEECEDDLILELGHVSRVSRNDFISELRQAVKVHALTDGKVALALLQAYDPEMTPTKKVEAKIKVEGPAPETMDNLSEEEAWAYREMERKRIGKGKG